MWLAKTIRREAPTADADQGVTTIAGGSAGVLTKGEVRALPVFGPGGYAWQPKSGETVLVIKGGTGGEESCVAGCSQQGAPAGLQPGEAYVYSAGGASVYLKNDGTLVLSGTKISLMGSVSVSGSLHINGHVCNAGETSSSV